MEKRGEEGAENGDRIHDQEDREAPENNYRGEREGEEEEEEEEEKVQSIEQIFQSKEVPPWKDQLTFRAFAVSFVLGVMFCFIVMKLELTMGIVPSLNISASLLGFFFVKTWTKFVEKSGLLKQPFTRQENTVIQTCVVAICGVSFSGGFGNYLLAMSEDIAKQTSTEANDSKNIKNLSLGWIVGFLFVVSFIGLFSIVPLRKIMIIDYKLIYPTGTATAHLINSFHAPQGARLAKKQVKALGKFFSLSFLWGFFQWFFTATDDCGFIKFPTFGLKAYDNRFYFDFSATYVGVGMICPHIINVSVLLGGILSWGLMWPLIEAKKGDWYSADLESTSLKGLQGYKVFIATAMIFGDGLYNFLKALVRSILALIQLRKDSTISLPVAASNLSHTTPSVSFDDQRRTQLFLKDQIPTCAALAGYISLASISIATLPYIFHPLKWYHVLVLYLFAPILGFCNAYGTGLTDWSLANNYGKRAIFTIGAWTGASNGGVLSGLAACGVVMNIVSSASDLMQDFKTGYLTLSSPRSMFVSQLIGTAIGCVISPSVFWIFYKAFPDLGHSGSKYSAPNAIVYRSVAILGVDGLSSLPKNCLTLCYVFCAAAIVINAVRDTARKNVSRFIPLPMAMAIPFYLGSYFAIDMCVGGLIVFVWERMNRVKARAFAPAVASGLICGGGIWTLPESILALAGVRPPICMKFLSRATNTRVDKFLRG